MQEKENLMIEERERILSELHDGVGGQLVSMLALLENRNVSQDELKDVVRGALDDLRMMIDSLDSFEGDIPVVLGMFRSRLEPRLKSQGVKFEWGVTDVPMVPRFGPHEVLQILRILQEATTNIIKHSGADVISILTDSYLDEEEKEIVRVIVKDNGVGDASKKPNDGYGMGIMHRRANSIGGDLTVTANKEGTSVVLSLPVNTFSQ